MAAIYDRLNLKKQRDLRVLRDFVVIFCRENHTAQFQSVFPMNDERLAEALGDKQFLLCSDCQRLLSHGMAKLLLCTQDPKPMCKKCQIHCYAPGYREKIQEVMRFSGLYLVKHGRLDLMAHYFF